MRTGDHVEALRIYAELERLEPEEATWPERRAGAHHALGDTEAELACLRRSLALLVDQGRVLPAIATCKLILDVRPQDPDALACLRRLSSEPGLATPDQGSVRFAAPEQGDGGDAPLEELELTEVIPDARALRPCGGGASGVAEIPLEERADGGWPADEIEVDPVDVVRAFDASPPVRSVAGRSAPPRTGCGRVHDVRRPIARDELLRTPLFGSLDATTLRRLLARVEVVHLRAGEVLFREGDPAETLYVVVEGAVVPIAEGPPRRRMAVLENGAFFGEIGLVTNRPRNATIEALVDTRLIAIDRPVIWSLIRGRVETSKVLLRFLRERLIDRTVRTHPFFAPLARFDLRDLARRFRFLEVRDGTALLEQGRPGRGLFVLLAGAMDVVDETADAIVDRLAPGDLFGGVALVGGEPAAASVVAAGKCWVLGLDEPVARRILAGTPDLERELAARAAAGRAGGLRV
jgi:CRP-like cAMP-binding protein